MSLVRSVLFGATVLAAALSLLSCRRAPKAIEERSSEESLQGDSAHIRLLVQVQCGSCHGSDGNSASSEIPKLAGQKSDYLYSQLLAFRSGKREHAVMGGISRPLTDAEAQGLAKYYSTEKREPDSPGEAELMARGKSVYSAKTSSMSGCITCHDPSGRSRTMKMGGVTGSINTSSPTLNGQDAAYLLRELNSFASGRRRSAVMGPIAASMSEEDRRAVAIYLSAQPQM